MIVLKMMVLLMAKKERIFIFDIFVLVLSNQRFRWKPFDLLDHSCLFLYDFVSDFLRSLMLNIIDIFI